MTPEFQLRKLAVELPDPLPDWPRVDARASIRAAAKLAGEADFGGVILTDAGAPTGVVLAGALLRTLALDEDPVTGLPRSGPLRDWLTEQLRSGREVSIVFLDLDRFGELNKAKGHTEGDRALARAGAAIREACTDQEFPARFGGDEFAVGSLRSNSDAETLAQKITRNLGAAEIPASAGVSGGRRSVPRDDANLGSMVEELLRLASVECLKLKPNRG